MRIVVFSDLYPPLFLGGYELGAAQVVKELKRRGHQVLLLTSRDYFLQQEDGVRYACHAAAESFLDTGLCVFGSLLRLFFTHPFRFLHRAIGTVRSRRRYRRAVAVFKPERVLLFNPLAVVAPVLHDLTELAHEAGAEVHAYVSDDWLARWPAVHPLLRPVARLRQRRAGQLFAAVLEWTGWAPSAFPRFDRYFFCSEYIRRLSLDKIPLSSRHEVLPWGLAGTERLPDLPADHFHQAPPLTLLYAGQIVEHKGLDVLLRALAICRRKHHLIVLGDDATIHAQSCKQLATELGLPSRVRFLGKQTHAETLTLLGQLGQVLVVPSMWDEPFSLVVLEGMALGLPVVASHCGGSAEVIRHSENGFLFERGRVEELKAILDELEIDRDLCFRVGTHARRAVQENYTIKSMVDRLLDDSATRQLTRPSAASCGPLRFAPNVGS